MREVGAARRAGDATDMFGRIGAFLAAHRLDSDPGTYAFVHAVLSQPDSIVAREVAELVDGGYRLSRADIERLGGRVAGGQAEPAPRERAKAEPTIDRSAADLVSSTQTQVDRFATMMRAMQLETRGFGQDLAETAQAIADANPRAIAQVSELASAMVSRVRSSETRLAQATEEADRLRAKLADAQSAARRDPLTGLPNRLAFSEAYAARDAGEGPHCLALCDVDKFKRINDAHGHGVGDRVLKAIGEALAESCGGQLVARYGGEEFAVLVAGKTLEEAGDCLDAARQAVANKRFHDRETGAALGTVTFSAGVTAVRAGEGPETSFDRADRLLYTAKAEGRDRVCVG